MSRISNLAFPYGSYLAYMIIFSVFCFMQSKGFGDKDVVNSIFTRPHVTAYFSTLAHAVVLGGLYASMLIGVIWHLYTMAFIGNLILTEDFMIKLRELMQIIMFIN